MTGSAGQRGWKKAQQRIEAYARHVDDARRRFMKAKTDTERLQASADVEMYNNALQNVSARNWAEMSALGMLR